MTEIYLICAAEDENSLYRIASGQADSNLTEHGWQQLRQLGQLLSGTTFDCIYSSDLYHGYMTAEAIRREASCPLCRIPELRDVCLGDWEGRHWGNIAYDMPVQLRNFRTHPERWRVAGAETRDEAVDRLRKTLCRIAAEQDGHTAAVVSHEMVMRWLLDGMDSTAAEEIPAVMHTAVYRIEADGEKLLLKDFRTTLHPDAQRARKEAEFDTNLYMQYLRLAEYGTVFTEAVKCIWEEAGEEEPFHADRVLEDAADYPTFVGYAEQTPVGFLQMSNSPGWITLICTRPDCRNLGLGTQLLGLAVMQARQLNCKAVRIALPQKNPHLRFFTEHGFYPLGQDADGRLILEKEICLREKGPAEA